jgi:hypothetical protein
MMPEVMYHSVETKLETIEGEDLFMIFITLSGQAKEILSSSSSYVLEVEKYLQDRLITPNMPGIKIKKVQLLMQHDNQNEKAE